MENFHRRTARRKLRVKVIPNARKSEIAGWEELPLQGRVLRVRLAASPVEGAANRELVAFLAKQFKVPKSQVVLEKGSTARIKQLQLPDAIELPD